MDTEQFDRFAVTLSRRTPRRAFLNLLAALGLTGLAAREAATEDVCLGNGENCGRATDPASCSGLSKRKHGSRKGLVRPLRPGTATLATTTARPPPSATMT